jgi:GH24 family phage-related lysozyme (muramidase)
MPFGHCEDADFGACLVHRDVVERGFCRMKSFLAVSALALLGTLSAAGQSVPAPAPPPPDAQTPAVAPVQTASPDAAIPVPSTIPGVIIRASEQAAATPDAVKTLMGFKPADAKFDVERLMDVLRDKRHEGWVLAAYPDPKTGQPLIGAGFSLDLPQRIHIQRDPLNPHPFLEPSSADLWLAAGLEPSRLDAILAQFHYRLDTWSKKGFRRQIWSLDPQITEDDANALLRVGIVQAIYNAKAYCRNFEHLTASQQMAMTQLVYQMGVNLEEFSTFLSLINRDNGNGPDELALARADAQYWHSVQLSLVQSQWARLYRDRAKAVIAMLDPNYVSNPSGAEHSVGKVLRPARTKRAHPSGLRKASYTKHHASAAKKHAARTRKN